MMNKIYKLSKFKTAKHATVLIDGIKYPVIIHGNGMTPCLCIGVGTLMQRTLSAVFKKYFTVYSVDLYWIKGNRLKLPTALTMTKITDDIFSVIDQLGLEKPLLLGNSTFGIVAAEAAKRCNANLRGVIMVASPPGWNDTLTNFARAYFDKHASYERKVNDKFRKEQYQLIKKPGESEVSINAYEADSARYWGNFEISREFIENLWRDVEADDEVFNHFFSTILPQHDLASNIKNIAVPVVLAGGRLDYDCVPLKHWEHYPKPQNFTILDCGDVGHWPNFRKSIIF